MSTKQLPENERIALFQEVFSHFDKVHEGTITLKDLEIVIQALGLDLPEDETKDISEQSDGLVNFEQFVNILNKKLPNLDSEEALMKLTFLTFDKDGNGLISAAELRDALTKDDNRPTIRFVKEFVKEFDVDGDGYINYLEFLKMVSTDNRL